MTNDNKQAPLTSEQITLLMFALDESKRSIESQHAELDKVRDRALAQLGFTGAIVTFMIGSVLDGVQNRDAEFYLWSIAVTTAGAVAVLLTFRVWRTVTNWRTKVSGTFIVEDFAETVTFKKMAVLIGHYDNARAKNEKILESKRDALRLATYSVGTLLLIVLVAMWRLV